MRSLLRLRLTLNNRGGIRVSTAAAGNGASLLSSWAPLPQSDPHRDHSEPDQNPPSESDLGHNLLTRRLENLPPGESVGTVFQGWMRDGFALDRDSILHSVSCLRRRRLHSRALEVMQWVVKERPYKVTELDYSYLLAFTSICHGIAHTQKLFLTVPKPCQNGLLDQLVQCCLDERFIQLSYVYMQKMRELSIPISSYAYHKLITVHLAPSRRNAIPDILMQMKTDGVKPHISTFNILLKMYANDHDIAQLSKIFDEMLRADVEPNETTYSIIAKAFSMARLFSIAETYVQAIERTKMVSTCDSLDDLIMLYGCLNKAQELDHTWKLAQQLPHVPPETYVLAIEAFGKVHSVSRAEEIWAKLGSSKEIDQTIEFNSILSVYCRYGIIERAIEIFKMMAKNKCKPNAITYRHLALGYLKVGRFKDAVKMIRIGRSKPLTTKVMRSVSWLETTLMVVEMFGQLGRLEYAELVFKDLKKSKYNRHAFVYNTLLKGYVTAKIYLPGLLERMIVDGAEPDLESHSLLNQIEQFKKSY